MRFWIGNGELISFCPSMLKKLAEPYRRSSLRYRRKGKHHHRYIAALHILGDIKHNLIEASTAAGATAISDVRAFTARNHLYGNW
jgi:hypothetical protein